MKNSIYIDNDELNVYATLHVKGNPKGIFILCAITVILISILFLFIASTPKEEAKNVVFPIIILSVITLLFPVKYLLWNLVGKEKLIINTKAICYAYDYGFLETNYEVLKFERLSLSFEQGQETNDQESGKLIFINYDLETDLPKILYETQVLIPRIEIERLESEIYCLFQEQYEEQNEFLGFSLN